MARTVPPCGMSERLAFVTNAVQAVRMDPLLRMTIFLDRFRRRPWSRAKVLVALAVLCGALLIAALDKLGYWPDALRAQSTRGHGVYRH